MPRVSEFEWRAPRESRRKLWLTVLLVGAGLGTGYFFVQSGREAHKNSLPLTAALDPQVSRPLQVPAQNEPSAIATVPVVPVQVEIINAPPLESAGQPNFPSPAYRSEPDSMAVAPNYASLRRELLRHLR
jgi:hypothetical protein